MQEEVKAPLVLNRNEVDSEDWKVISALFSIPNEATRIVITYSSVEYYMEGSDENS